MSEMQEIKTIIVNGKPKLQKYDYNVVECYGLLTEVRYIINPEDKRFIRMCMNPNECIVKKLCKYKKEGEI